MDAEIIFVIIYFQFFPVAVFSTKLNFLKFSIFQRHLKCQNSSIARNLILCKVLQPYQVFTCVPKTNFQLFIEQRNVDASSTRVPLLNCILKVLARPPSRKMLSDGKHRGISLRACSAYLCISPGRVNGHQFVGSCFR